jgi:transcriptional regulator of acetoin/glycerol metabolism
MCEEGKFRWDLYYRLAVAEIEIPSLLERGPAEIEATLHYLIRKKQIEMKASSPLQFDNEAWKFLVNYHYPGNIREMENLIESLYVFAENRVNVADLPKRLRTKSVSSYLLEDAVMKHILWVTDIYQGKKQQASEALGISYNTYKSKIRAYNNDV